MFNEQFSYCRGLLGSMFDVRLFEAKIQVFEFNHLYMITFKFVRSLSSFDVRLREINFGKGGNANESEHV